MNEASAERIGQQAPKWNVTVVRETDDGRRGIGLVCEGPDHEEHTLWSYRAWREWKLRMRARAHGFLISWGVDVRMPVGSSCKCRVVLYSPEDRSRICAAHGRTYTHAYWKAKRRAEA